jgi:hypothetical protein
MEENYELKNFNIFCILNSCNDQYNNTNCKKYKITPNLIDNNTHV